MRIFRIATVTHGADALSGEGARLYGGRWNPKGLPMVYAAATRSLALLEMLVQDQPLRARYVFIPVEVPSRLRMTRLKPSDLPTDWRKPSAGARLQVIGRNWLDRGDSAVLTVPSAVLPQEDNFLLNPRHADFKRLGPGAAELLDTDSRLLHYAWSQQGPTLSSLAEEILPPPPTAATTNTKPRAPRQQRYREYVREKRRH